MRLSLKAKIISSIILITTVIYIIALSITVYLFYKDTINSSLRYTNKILDISSNYFASIIDRDMQVLRTVKIASITFRELNNEKIFRKLQKDFCTQVLYSTPQFLSLSINWQISALQHDPSLYGRIRYTYYRSEGMIRDSIDTLETQGDNILGLYYKYKISKKEGMTEPYYYSYTKTSNKKILMTSLVTPILSNNMFQGLAVADIGLEHFYELLNEIKPYDYMDNFLISHTEKFIAFTNHKKYTDKPITNYFGDIIYTRYIKPNFTEKRSFTFQMKDKNGSKYYLSFYPIKIGNFDKPWYLGTLIPRKKILQPIQKLVWISVYTSSILILILLFFSILLANNFVKLFDILKNSIEKLATGDINNAEKIDYKGQNEFKDIANGINKLIDNLKKLVDFAHAIEQGNLNYKFQKISEHDVLGQAFLDMRKSLKIAKIEENKRKEEEEIHNWMVRGENMISEILREYNQDLKELSYQVVSKLVKYTNSVQGGLFIINDEDPENKYIELVAAYAYDKRKLVEKRIPYGVGLIGRAIIEGETIHLTNIPPDYLSLTSGLGDRYPNSLLIVPFKFNEVIYAVIELAAFERYKPYVRQFVERVGVSIASTIANLKITEQTKRLVAELRARSNELTAQEEEMRQNLEEMRTIQDELRKKATELENIVNALNRIAYVFELNDEGYIININDLVIKLLKKSRKDLIGKYFFTLLSKIEPELQYDNILNDLRNNKTIILKARVDVAKLTFWLNLTFVPITIDNDVQKIVVIGNDITKFIQSKN